MTKVRITRIYEYKLSSPENYPVELTTDQERMELDKWNVEENGVLLEEFTEIKEDKWEIVQG